MLPNPFPSPTAEEAIPKASLTVTRTWRSVPCQQWRLHACNIVACPLQSGPNTLQHNFIQLPELPLVRRFGQGTCQLWHWHDGTLPCRALCLLAPSSSIPHAQRTPHCLPPSRLQDAVIVQMTAGDQLLFCVEIALCNPPPES